MAALLKDLRAEDRVVISSFNPLELVRMRACSPRLPLAVLFESASPHWLGPTLAVGAQAVHPEAVLCTPRRLAAWAAAGLPVAAWTVDDPLRAEQLADAGVAAVVTNRPGPVKATLERTRRLR